MRKKGAFRRAGQGTLRASERGSAIAAGDAIKPLYYYLHRNCFVYVIKKVLLVAVVVLFVILYVLFEKSNEPQLC